MRREALRLFLDKGFDATTAGDIAAAVGTSARSFFRYFPTKEDVLVGESIPFGTHVRDALTARPADEPIWPALRAALDRLIDEMATDHQRSLDMMRVIMSTPALRAYHFEKHLAWEDLLVPVVESRLNDGDALRARTLAHSALACLDVALAEWVGLDGKPDLGALLDTVFATVAAL